MFFANVFTASVFIWWANFGKKLDYL